MIIRRLYLLLVILNLQTLFCQDFFPIKSGNEYLRQFYTYQYQYHWGSGSTTNTALFYDSTTVTDSIIFNAKTFFKYWNFYYHYDRQNQKLFILLSNEMKLAVDFLAPQGSKDTLYFDNEVYEYESSGIFEDMRYGKLRNCFSITHVRIQQGPNFGYPYEKWTYQYTFVDSVGLFIKINDYFKNETPDDIERIEKSWKNVIVDRVSKKYSELERPTIESLMPLTDTKILIKWSSSHIRDGFIIESKTSEEIDFAAVDTASSADLTYIDNSVLPGFQYHYRIRILKSGMTSLPSDTLTVNNILHPGILAADTLTSGKITLSWNYNTTVYDGFIIERKHWINQKPWSIIWSDFGIIDTIEHGITHYEDTNVSFAPYFAYRLRAYKDTLYSLYTPITVATPLFPVPLTPQNVKFENITSQQNLITWERNDKFLSYFEVERKELSGPNEFKKLLDHYVIDTFFVDNNITSPNSYAYRIKARFAHRQSGYSDTIYTSITSVEGAELPIAFELVQNYPNPFNPTTIISFSIPKQASVLLSVYSVLGEKIMDLVDGEMPRGEYKIEFNANNLSSGIYFYRIIAGNSSSIGEKLFIDTKKMILIR